MYPQNPPPQYSQPNGNPSYDYSHAPPNPYQYQPQDQQPPQQTWANDSSQIANNANRNPHTQDLLTDNPFIEKKPVNESLMDFSSSGNQQQPQPQQRIVKNQQQMYSNVQPPSVNPPPNHQPTVQPPKQEMDPQSLLLINQMQSYFLKIMQYMDNVDKRITSLEKMTKELQEKASSAPASADFPRKVEVEGIKKAQETLEQDLELARKLQSEFNDEVSKASKPKTTPTPVPSTSTSTIKKAPSSGTGTSGPCPVCGKITTNVEAHVEECLAETERLEKLKPKPGNVYELGKQPPQNAMPTNRPFMNTPMPPTGQPPYFPYPYLVQDPQTGQVGYYQYPPPPPNYPGNPQK